MTLSVEATYENGTLKPKQPLALAEGAAVQLTIVLLDEGPDLLDAVIGICETGISDGAANHDKYIYGKLRPDLR